MADPNINPIAPEIQEYISNDILPMEEYQPMIPITSIPEEEQKSTNLESMLLNAASTMPKSVDPTVARVNTPVMTDILPSLRYNDPNLGYTPFDPNLEDKYAREHYIQNTMNNFVGFGTKYLSSYLSALSFIPTAIASLTQPSGEKWNFLMGNNPFSEMMERWNRAVDENLPVYRTNNEEEHPMLKYFMIGDPVTAMNAWGSLGNQLGFTLGAVSGALTETAIITAITGGTGFFPALAKNVGQFALNIGRLGRLVGLAPKSLKAMEGFLTVGNTLRVTQAAGNVTADIVTQTKNMNALKRIIQGGSTFNKIRDRATYELGLITSAYGEGIFERGQVYHDSRTQMLDEYFKRHGKLPELEELRDIENKSQKAANLTMYGNLAILYMSNKLNWGSLFKPTKQYIRGTAITGWGKGIARLTKQRTIQNGSFVYNVVSKTPSSALGKMYLNGERVFKGVLKRGLGESAEEGLQFITSRGTTDYAVQSFDPDNVKEATDYLKTFSNAFEDLFTTNEGLENLMGGLMGGIFGGKIMDLAMRRRSIHAKEKLEQEAKNLSATSLSNIFTLNEAQNIYNQTLSNPTYKAHAGLVGKIENLAERIGLAKKHDEAIKKGDLKTAKDIRDDMAYSYWADAHYNGVIDARKEEIEAARHLEGDSFVDFWGMEHTAENVKKVNSFLDSTLEQADKISKNIDIIKGAFPGNPHNKKKNHDDWRAYEKYKIEIARVLTRAEFSRDRMLSIAENLRKKSPLLNIDNIIQLTHNEGLNQTFDEIEQELVNLKTQIEAIKENPEDTEAVKESNRALKEKLTKYHENLSTLRDEFSEIFQEVEYEEEGAKKKYRKLRSSSYVSRKHMDILKKLIDLRSGPSMEDNEYMKTVNVNNNLSNILAEASNETFGVQKHLTDKELADFLQSAQDLYQLSEDQLHFQRLYNYLISKQGETSFMKKIREAQEEFAKKIEIGEDGSIKIKTEEHEEKVEEIKKEEYGKVEIPDDVSEEEAEIVKSAVEKDEAEWTEEEKEMVKKYKDLYEKYQEAKERIRELIDELNRKSFEAAFKDFSEKTGLKVDDKTQELFYNGISPDHLLSSLFYNPYESSSKYPSMPQMEVNMFDALFNSPLHQLLGALSFKISVRPTMEFPAEMTAEERAIVRNAAYVTPDLYTDEQKVVDSKYPGVIDKYRESGKNFNVINRFDKKGKATNTKLYRRDSIEVIQVFYKGKPIGEMRQPESLYIKDEKGNFVRIVDNEGNLLIDKDSFTDLTGNREEAFESFKDEIESYSKAYTTLFNEIEGGKKPNGNDISHLFSFVLDGGSLAINHKTQIGSDATLSESDIKKTAIFELVRIKDSEGNVIKVEIDKDSLVNLGLEQETIDKLLTSIEKPEIQEALLKVAKGSKSPEVLMAVVPVYGMITANSFIRARRIDPNEGVTRDNIKISAPGIPFIRYSLSLRSKANNEGNKKNTTTATKGSATPTESIPAKRVLPKTLKKKDKVEIKVNDTTYTVEFEDDLDRALYDISRGTKSKTRFDLVRQWFKDIEGVELTDEQIKTRASLLSKMLERMLTSSSETEVKIAEGLQKASDIFSSPVTIKEDSDLSSQDPRVVAAVKEKANKEDPTYDALETAIQKAGYNIVYEETDEPVKNPQPYTVYINNNSIYVYGSTNKVVDEVYMTTDTNKDGNVQNVYNLYIAYQRLLKEKPKVAVNENTFINISDLKEGDAVVDKNTKKTVKEIKFVEDKKNPSKSKYVITFEGFKTAVEYPKDHVFTSNTPMYNFDDTVSLNGVNYTVVGYTGNLYELVDKDGNKATAKDYELQAPVEEKKEDGKYEQEKKESKEESSTELTEELEAKKADIERREGFNGLEEIIFSNPNFRLEGFKIDGNYWNVVTSTDRAKVLVNINGVIVPFYLTTGQAGKGLIHGWYPFFGIGKDGWLNKTDKSDMETYYERYWGKETADIVKSISEELNNFYGTDPSIFKNDGDPNATSRPLTTLADKVEDYINSKLGFKPAINDANARKTLRNNVEQLGKEINAKYDALENQSSTEEELTDEQVEKFFEDNPDIANEIYEELGIENNNPLEIRDFSFFASYGQGQDFQDSKKIGETNDKLKDTVQFKDTDYTYRITQLSDGRKKLSIHFRHQEKYSTRGGGHAGIAFVFDKDKKIDEKLIEKLLPLVEDYRDSNFTKINETDYKINTNIPSEMIAPDISTEATITPEQKKQAIEHYKNKQKETKAKTKKTTKKKPATPIEKRDVQIVLDEYDASIEEFNKIQDEINTSIQSFVAKGSSYKEAKNKATKAIFSNSKKGKEKLQKYLDLKNKIEALSTELESLGHKSISAIMKEIEEEQLKKPIYVKSKEDVADVLKAYFGYSEQQASMLSLLYDMFIRAEAAKNNTTVEETYSKYGFGNQELFDILARQNSKKKEEIFFSTKAYPNLEKEYEQAVKKGNYPAGKTNLTESLWYLTQTKSFKEWFGNSKTVDENGDPKVVWHWSPVKDITMFNLAGFGAHSGTKESAIDRKNTYEQTRGETEGMFYPMFIRMENPLMMVDIGIHDINKYSILELQNAFLEAGIELTEEDLSPFKGITSNRTGEHTHLIKELLNKYGFDGITYYNAVEDVEASIDYSYISVDTQDIRIVSAEEIHKGNPNKNQQTTEDIDIDDINKCM